MALGQSHGLAVQNFQIGSYHFSVHGVRYHHHYCSWPLPVHRHENTYTNDQDCNFIRIAHFTWNCINCIHATFVTFPGKCIVLKIKKCFFKSSNAEVKPNTELKYRNLIDIYRGTNELTSNSKINSRSYTNTTIVDRLLHFFDPVPPILWGFLADWCNLGSSLRSWVLFCWT